MAKKGSTTRVFQLAKDLGVSSKDIVEKCKAEDIPGITNHMSAVNIGLAATIREWFGGSEGEGQAVTAVETAPRVDVAEARAKAKKKATRKRAAKKKTTPKTEPAPAAEAPAEAAPTAEAPPEQPTAETTEAPPAAAEAPAEAAPTAEALEGQPTADAPAEEADQAAEAPLETEAALAAEAPSDGGPAESTAGEERARQPGDAGPEDMRAVPNVPSRPEVVEQVGRKLQQPSKTKLAGPKVIRVEKAEPVAPPRPARGRGGGPSRGRGAPMEEPAMPPMGRGVGGGSGGGGRDSSRRNKRRSAASGRDTGRSGRSGQADQSGRFNWREQDLLERERRLNRAAGYIRSARRDNLKKGEGAGQKAQTAAVAGGTVKVEEPITIKGLSAATGLKVNDIVRSLVKAGHMMANADAVLPSELAQEIVLEHNIELEVVQQKSAEAQIAEQFEHREMMDERPRGPVVTILGHVDHGKTTLLDTIRHAKVAAEEAGGITQATSAFQVPVQVGDDQRLVTFIDTPGHEAFTEMRSRGARVTDVVVLVVAADDGVMPQTVESINHAKAAGVPIVIALNKVDKAEATDANIQRILGQLTEHDLNPVEWGGDTEIVRVSALQGEGVTELLEVLDYQAQLLDLTADFGGQAEGTVIEAQLEEGRGPVARMLVQQGQLKKGDFIAVGRAYGRVRDIINDQGKRIDEAGPSVPVAISGLNEIPDAGDKFYVVKNLREAEAAAEERKREERERGLAKEKVTLDNIFDKLSEADRKELPLVVKADVQGSLETLKATLGKIGSDEVQVAIKHAAVGGVNDSDIQLAEAAGAIIVGFNVTASSAARRMAENKGVDIRFYDVIYDLTDDVTKAAEGLLEPELKLEVLGQAEVREVFRISKVGMVAGCYVTEGNVERDAQIRVTRDGIVVEKDRRLSQLKRFKDDAKQVQSGQECGMLVDGYDDIQPGDVLECYKTREIRRTL